MSPPPTLITPALLAAPPLPPYSKSWVLPAFTQYFSVPSSPAPPHNPFPTFLPPHLRSWVWLTCPSPSLHTLRELGVAGSYTMEASLGGKSADRTHFNTRDYLSQGRSLGR